ncbi:MAG: large conductance mechanosensitive channel protein MscL [Lachnospiraceae bacterium]|nr:large conductance mechanosensitive channel protein MscL [Lachnospiraceae bacterium]
MKKFVKEFKEFAVKGNMVDMAIGVIIGGAFTALVTAFTGNIVNPLLALIPGVNSLDNTLKIVIKEAQLDAAGAVVAEEVAIKFGAFIAAIITFLILAFIIFILVKGINKMRAKKEAPVTTKTCPFCKSEIPLEAVRCPHCTSELPAVE